MPTSEEAKATNDPLRDTQRDCSDPEESADCLQQRDPQPRPARDYGPAKQLLHPGHDGSGVINSSGAVANAAEDVISIADGGSILTNLGTLPTIGNNYPDS